MSFIARIGRLASTLLIVAVALCSGAYICSIRAVADIASGASRLNSDIEPSEREAAPAETGTPTQPGRESAGRCKRYAIVSHTVRPRKNRRTRDIFIWTPQGYEDAANQQTRYPVIYLLHGSPGNPHDFSRLGHWLRLVEQEIGAGTVRPVILVMPDGNYEGNPDGDSEWVNSADGRDNYEDFITQEVVPWTDDHFRTVDNPNDRILGGVSEGAYGAINIGLHNTSLFHKLFAFSGYYVNDGSGWARGAMGYDPAYCALKSPLTQLNNGSLKLPDSNSLQVFLGAGEQENPIYITQAKQLAKALRDAGVSVKSESQSGKHGWQLWTKFFDATMNWMESQTKSDGDPASIPVSSVTRIPTPNGTASP